MQAIDSKALKNKAKDQDGGACTEMFDSIKDKKKQIIGKRRLTAEELSAILKKLSLRETPQGTLKSQRKTCENRKKAIDTEGQERYTNKAARRANANRQHRESGKREALNGVAV